MVFNQFGYPRMTAQNILGGYPRGIDLDIQGVSFLEKGHPPHEGYGQ